MLTPDHQLARPDSAYRRFSLLFFVLAHPNVDVTTQVPKPDCFTSAVPPCGRTKRKSKLGDSSTLSMSWYPQK